MKRRYWIGIVATLALAPVAWQAWNGNFHSVVDGEVYRSAQLSPADLGARIDKLKIRSVLNLRGEDPGMEWYDGELAAARAHGVEHVDFLMTSGTALTNAQTAQLVGLMERMPKPMLIHCWGGADRTGLASALYLYGIKHQPAEQAQGQLSFRYGHVPYLLWAKTRAMDETFDRYVKSNPGK